MKVSMSMKGNCYDKAPMGSFGGTLKGTCVACIAACPATAIKEEAALFDHKGCYEMLGRFRKERNIGHHICGICVSACKGER
jgi:epoxyqueuosine reductase QueG